MPEALAFGFEPVELPCIRIDVLTGGAERLAAAASDADALVLTSVRAAAMLAPVGVASLPVIAVGPETAATVRESGGSVVWVGSRGIRHLARDAQHLLAGKKVIVAGASNTMRGNAAALETAGSSVVSIELYTTVPVGPGDDAVDAVVFGSPTAVTGWLMSRELSGLLIGAIGPTTAASLRMCGVEPDAVPDRPGFTNMIERLAELRLERSIP